MNSPQFREKFEASLETMADDGTFDIEAVALIDSHFKKSDKPFGIERARAAVVQRLMKSFDASHTGAPASV